MFNRHDVKGGNGTCKGYKGTCKRECMKMLNELLGGFGISIPAEVARPNEDIGKISAAGSLPWGQFIHWRVDGNQANMWIRVLHGISRSGRMARANAHDFVATVDHHEANCAMQFE